MAGTWPPNILAGSYINFESSGSSPVEPGAFGRVGMPIRANWGPENEFVDIVTDADRIAAYGNSDGSVTSTADTSWLIREAILGGAELVKAYRMVGDNASKASGVLVDASANTIVTAEAKYSGVRGNLIRVRVAQNNVYSYKRDLIVEELAGSSWSRLEAFTYDADDVSRLVTNVNANSSFVTLALDAAAADAVNEEQELEAASATSGKFRIQYFDGANSFITNDIEYNDNAATVEGELEAIVGSGNVSVSGTDVTSILTVTFQGALAGKDIYALTIAAPTDPAENIDDPVIVTTVLEGSPTQNEIQTITITSGIAGPNLVTFTVNDGSGAQTTGELGPSADAAAIQSALEALLGVGNVTVTGAGTLGTSASVFTVKFVGALTGQNIAQITKSGPGTFTIATTEDGQPEALDIQSVQLAGGSNGDAVTLSSYTDALAALEAEGGFDLLALDGANEESFAGLNAALKVWADTNNAAGRYVMVVVGGGNVELANAGGAGLQTAIARSKFFDSEWVVNVGVSGLKVTSPAGNELNLSGAQSAARVAGMIAAAGITGSVTFGEVAGVEAVNGPLAPAALETAVQSGMIVFSKRGAAVRVEDGVTSFTSITDEKDFTFTQIRAVRAIQTIGSDISAIVEQDWIGKRVNTTSVRDSLVSRLKEYFTGLEAQRVLVNGTEVSIDTRYNNTRTDVYVLVLAQFQFELKRVLLTVRVPTVA